MPSERPLTAVKRHFLALLIGAIPAGAMGVYVGLYAAGLGAGGSLATIFLRTLVCAVPLVVFALLVPRAWLLPALIYAFGFSVGYDVFDTLRPIGVLGMAPPSAAFISKVTGEPLWRALPSDRSELPWLLVLAFWAGAFVAFLRRHYWRVEKEA